MENKIKCEGEIKLGNNIIPCYVLEDGTRVLSGRGMQDALKLVDEDSPQKAGSRLTRLFNNKALKPFIINRFAPDHFTPLICYKGNTKIHGYEATLLVDICDSMLEARKSNKIKLTDRQKIIADECEILLRAFAKVGIIALIDEATGYQYEREQFELQAILKLFVSEEILESQKPFEIGFYKEIFRLWNIPFTPKNIRFKPSFVGRLTNKFIYENMPKGIFILEKLKSKTPKTKSGNFKYRLHRSLTAKIGIDALRKVLTQVETLASISKDKAHFLRLMQEKYGQKEIPFEDIDEAPKTQPKETNYQQTEIDEGLTHLLNIPSDKDKK